LVSDKLGFDKQSPIVPILPTDTVLAVKILVGTVHSVDRVIGFFSSRPIWKPPPPPPSPSDAGECVPHPFGPGGGGTHSHAGEGIGGPNSDEGTDTVVYSRYEYICTLWYRSSQLRFGKFKKSFRGRTA
jgi:hypothetical protein